MVGTPKSSSPVSAVRLRLPVIAITVTVFVLVIVVLIFFLLFWVICFAHTYLLIKRLGEGLAKVNPAKDPVVGQFEIYQFGKSLLGKNAHPKLSPK